MTQRHKPSQSLSLLIKYEMISDFVCSGHTPFRITVCDLYYWPTYGVRVFSGHNWCVTFPQAFTQPNRIHRIRYVNWTKNGFSVLCALSLAILFFPRFEARGDGQARFWSGFLIQLLLLDYSSSSIVFIQFIRFSVFGGRTQLNSFPSFSHRNIEWKMEFWKFCDRNRWEMREVCH